MPTRKIKAVPETNGLAHPPADSNLLKVSALSVEEIGAETLLKAYRLMLTARRLDEKMLMLLKQGRGYFHIGCSGHEAAQIAVGLNMKPGYDWASPYYRDLSFVLSLGIESVDIIRHHLSKATDPFSGGRQMSEHYSSKKLNCIVQSASVGVQYLPAVGMAMAAQKQKIDAIAYTAGGEGSTSQGGFFEAVNWASRIKAPVLFHIQDNKYAISVPSHDQTAGGSITKAVGGFQNLTRIEADGTDFFEMMAAAKAAVAHLRAGKGPVCIHSHVVRLLPHSSSDNHDKYRDAKELEEDRKIDPIIRFEHRLIEAGLLTQPRITELRDEVKKEIDSLTLEVMKEADPVADTVEQYVLFEGDLGLEYEKSVPSGEPIVMVDAINKALKEEMALNDKVVVFGEDVADGKGGVFTATRDLTTLFGKDRCFNSPLAEDSIMGTACGLSAAGFMPVVEIQFGDYIWPAVHQLRNMISTIRYRSNNEWECPMVIRTPIGGYIHGGLYHSQNIEAFFAHMPGFKIVMPSNAADAKGLLKTAIRSKDPIIFLEHKFLYRQPVARTPEPDADYLVPIGKAKIVQEGKDLTIVTYGAMVHKTTAALRTLQKEGISAEVIDLRSIYPLDMETVVQSVQKTGRVIVIHEDHTFCGFGAEVAAQIADECFQYLDAPVKRLGGLFIPIPFADVLEKAALPQDEDIIREVRALAAF